LKFFFARAARLIRLRARKRGEEFVSDNRIDHPRHYTSHPSGVECITVVEHMGFCIGNAIKYLWRADLKDNALEDLEKAKWYITREIDRRKMETR